MKLSSNHIFCFVPCLFTSLQTDPSLSLSLSFAKYKTQSSSPFSHSPSLSVPITLSAETKPTLRNNLHNVKNVTRLNRRVSQNPFALHTHTQRNRPPHQSGSRARRHHPYHGQDSTEEANNKNDLQHPADPP